MRQKPGLFITAAIAIHNIPEGLAVALVMVPKGTKAWKAALWSIFSSLPQPLIAVPAFLFVLKWIRELRFSRDISSTIIASIEA